MRILIGITIVLFVSCFAALGKGKKSHKNAGNEKTDTTTILTDTYKGDILGSPACRQSGDYTMATELELQHHPYADDGTFILKETRIAERANSSKITKGNWTVIKGDANNENATVVEIDGPRNEQFFLRRKNGNLQKLDTLLGEIKPVSKFMLKQQ